MLHSNSELKNSELKRALFWNLDRQVPMALVANVIFSMLVCAVYYRHIPTSILVLFSSVLMALVFLRALLHWGLKRYHESLEPIELWHSIYVVSAAAVGLVWGLLGAYVVMSLSLVVSVHLMLIIICLATGAMAINSSSKEALIAFVVPVLFPVIGSHFVVGNVENTIFGGATILFFVVLWLGSKSIHCLICSSISYGLKNASLLNDVEVKQEKIVDLNKRLYDLLAKQDKVMKKLESANKRAGEVASDLYVRSTTDSLTGIANRRFFDEMLEKEWNIASREKTALSLILFDLDQFKAYNDEFGHQAGDDCLVKVTSAIASCVRRSGEVFARYGGEEFALLLPRTDEFAAKKIAESIRQRVFDAKIPHAAASNQRQLTISLGVCTLMPDVGRAKHELVARADKALYRAKDEGRNCVITSAKNVTYLPFSRPEIG